MAETASGERLVAGDVDCLSEPPRVETTEVV